MANSQQLSATLNIPNHFYTRKPAPSLHLHSLFKTSWLSGIKKITGFFPLTECFPMLRLGTMILSRSRLFAWLLLLQYALRMVVVWLFMRFLIAHIAPSLTEALPGWPAAYCTITFLVQLCMLMALYELREYFVCNVRPKLLILRATQVRPVLAGSWLIAAAGMAPNLLLAFSCTRPWSMILLPQTGLLLGFTWVTAGYAVPLAAWRHRIYWVKYPRQTHITILRSNNTQP
jgi:hypothetical protein